MHKLKEITNLKAGSPQFRVKESQSKNARIYFYYTAESLRYDLYQEDENADPIKTKQISTEDKVVEVSEGDLIFSLMSSQAAIAGKSHEGYLLTQNFVKIQPDEGISKSYLAYIINEDKVFRKSLDANQQGFIPKITIRDLSESIVRTLPSIEKQKLIGDTYLKQKRLSYIRSKRMKLEDDYILELLKEGI